MDNGLIVHPQMRCGSIEEIGLDHKGRIVTDEHRSLPPSSLISLFGTHIVLDERSRPRHDLRKSAKGGAMDRPMFLDRWTDRT